MMRFTSEEDILNEEFRKQVIDEIVKSEENRERKFQAVRRDEIYQDQSKKWVMHAVEKEGYKKETVEQIRNRATNISFAKKVVNKKARAYSGGVQRKTDVESDNESITKIEALLNVNTVMRKWDRKLELHRNALLKIVPVCNQRETKKSADGRHIYELVLRVLTPWQYDVIEDPHNKERAAVIIESEFAERGDIESDQDGAQGIRNKANLGQSNDGKNQAIADSPEDDQAELKCRRFIWWSDSYHFTTDYQGKVVDFASPDLANPIEMLPYVNAAKDQDGYFWAKGADDLVDASISLNKALTDIKFIEWLQGWGQLVIAGKDIPNDIVGGPDKAMIFPQQPGETTQVFYATSNPPIEAMLETVRAELAMFLSTNGLSTRHVAAKLDSASATPSALALMVEDADVITDIKDSRELFTDLELEYWTILNAWWVLYSKLKALVPWQQEVPPLKSTKMTTKFHESKAPTTEKEKVETLKARKEAGLITHAQMLREDNPDLSEADAKKLAQEIKDEKAAAAPQLTPGNTEGAPPGQNANQGPPGANDEEKNDDEEDDDA